MKVNDIITEVNMSPSNLSKLAPQTGARVGFEFEVYVPDSEIDYDYYDPQPDWDYDENVKYINDIIDFFENEQANEPDDLDDIVSELTEEYQVWFQQKILEAWDKKKIEHTVKILDEEMTESEIIEFALTKKLIPNHYYSTDKILKIVDAGSGRTTDKQNKEIYDGLSDNLDYILDLCADYYLGDDPEDDTDNRFFESFQDDFKESEFDDLQEDFLISKKLTKYSNIKKEYDLNWPYYKELDREEMLYDYVATEMKYLFNKEVYWSSEYHKTSRGDWYVIEPDGSLSPRSGYEPIEIISPTPPPDIEESIKNFLKFHDYARSNGYETNSKTGLHISISTPNYSLEKIDLVKLILFMGDRYVLEKFNRIGNTYTESVFDKLAKMSGDVPRTKLAELFTSIKSGIEANVKKLIGLTITNKHVSANLDQKRVEFRGPGDDWLSKDPDEVVNTVRRFAVALDIACDPTKYREEYAKKLYKMFASETNGDVVELFSMYSSGAISPSDLKFSTRTKSYDKNYIIDTGDYYISTYTTGLNYPIEYDQVKSNIEGEYGNIGLEVPTIKELKLIYSKFKNKIGKYYPDFYWSSSIDSSGTKAWALHMYSGRVELKDLDESCMLLLVKREPKK